MNKRCVKCNLPSNYPRIVIEEDGICNFCKLTSGKFYYEGLDKLKEIIDEILKNSDKNRKYDCIVGCSGGRDSSYLLYFAKKILNLNVLAVTLEHDFMPKQTKQNIINMTKKLNVDVKFIKNEILNESSRKCVKAWTNKPDIAMCLTFCTGCRYGIKKIIPKYARENNIPILLVGDTPFEDIDYRVNLLCDNKEINEKNKMIGYGKRILKNPSYLLSPISMYNQLQDFKSFKDKNKYPIKIAPFSYVEWKQDEVIPKIKELGWKYDESLNSSWRSDCYVNILRQFFYKKQLGYNDLDVYYAKQIRNNEMDKETALKLIEKEGKYEEKVVKKILKDYYDVDYEKVIKKINLQQKN